MSLRVGVLALQGNFREHAWRVRELGAEPVEVRLLHHLEGVHGLILPGGESTTIGKLMAEYGFLDELPRLVQAGRLGLFGTCAGMILMATEIVGSDQPRLGVLPMRVRRNAFGRQRESFEIDLEVEALGPEPLRAVFIRAPYVEEVLDRRVEVLARVEGRSVLVRAGALLAAAFHPEMTAEMRIHALFLRSLCELHEEALPSPVASLLPATGAASPRG